jgi:hypothetical protein
MRPRERLERALRLAVRDRAEVIALPSGDRAFAVLISYVLESFLHVRRAEGLSCVSKAVETDFQRARNAAVLERTIEVVHDAGLTYLRPCWIGVATF